MQLMHLPTGDARCNCVASNLFGFKEKDTALNRKYPVMESTLGEFINTVMLPEVGRWAGNDTHPDIRCVFNTVGKAFQPGLGDDVSHPLWKDVRTQLGSQPDPSS